jgi:dGTPase
LLYEAVRRMLSSLVYDVMQATQAWIEQAGVEHAADVRHRPILVRFSTPVHEQSVQLKRFLLANLYRHDSVMKTTRRAQQVVTDLFEHYTADVACLPHEHQARVEREGHAPRIVADYIAGMTDRFAIKEHMRLTGSQLFADG